MSNYPSWLSLGDMHGCNIDRISSLYGLAEAHGILFAGDFVRQKNVEARQAIEAFCSVTDNLIAVPGNSDDLGVDGYLNEKKANLHRKVKELYPGVMIMGLGGSTKTGFNTPREYREEDYALWLDQMSQQVKKGQKIVLLAHNPPFNTGADVIFSGKHVGSLAVREFIECVQPDLCICGHLHESRTMEKFGRTLLVNNGSFMDGGYSIIRLTEKGFEAELQTL